MEVADVGLLCSEVVLLELATVCCAPMWQVTLLCVYGNLITYVYNQQMQNSKHHKDWDDVHTQKNKRTFQMLSSGGE